MNTITGKAGKAGKFSAAVIPAANLVPLARWILWIIAGLLICISVVGNFVQFNGGWERWRVWDEATGQALFYAIGWQFVCCILQYVFLYTKSWPGYFFFLLGSIVPSFLSFYPVVGPAVSGWLVSKQHMPPGIAQALAAFFVAAGVASSDWLPEQILVRR